MNIGVISYFRERGLYYLSEMFCKALEKVGNVYVLAKPEGTALKPIVTSDFSRDVCFLESTDVSAAVLQWARDNSLDVVFSFETHANLSMNFSILTALKEGGNAKLVEVPMADCFWKTWVDERVYDIFDAVVCLTEFTYKIFSERGFKNARYIRPGFVCSSGGVRKDDTIVYFHPGGWGGSLKRKNSINVLWAFDRASSRRDIELLFHSQMQEPEFRRFYSREEIASFDNIRRNPRVTVHLGTLPRAVFLDWYSRSDATVCPTLREGLGLTVFESMALGRPCITTDAPPMNEVITHGENGWLCKLQHTQPVSNSFTPLYHPAVADLERILKALTKEQLLKMEPVVHETVNDRFSWGAFEENIASLLEDVL